VAVGKYPWRSPAGTGPCGYRLGDLHPFMSPGACTVLRLPSSEISKGYFCFYAALITARGSAHPAQAPLDGAGTTQVPPEKLVLFCDVSGMT